MPGDPATIQFSIRGPIARDDLPGLSRRVCALLGQTRAAILVCDVSGIAVDAVTVDALARLALAAGRHNCLIKLQGSSPDLAGLIGFMGLEPALLAPSRYGQSG